MTYLLDTNACIHFLNGTSRGLAERLRGQDPARIRLSSVVKAELLFGARRSARASANLALLERFFAPFVTLAFDDACARAYGVIRASLAAAGTPIGPNDLLIAATAVAHALTLVTHNTREFQRVPGLMLEDWESPLR